MRTGAGAGGARPLTDHVTADHVTAPLGFPARHETFFDQLALALSCHFKMAFICRVSFVPWGDLVHAAQRWNLFRDIYFWGITDAVVFGVVESVMLYGKMTH